MECHEADRHCAADRILSLFPASGSIETSERNDRELYEEALQLSTERFGEAVITRCASMFFIMHLAMAGEFVELISRVDAEAAQ